MTHIELETISTL